LWHSTNENAKRTKGTSAVTNHHCVMFCIFRKACYFDICSLMDHRSINQTIPRHIDDLAKKCSRRESILRVLDRGLKKYKSQFPRLTSRAFSQLRILYFLLYWLNASFSPSFASTFISSYYYLRTSSLNYSFLYSVCSFLTRDQMARASTTLTHRQSTCTQHTAHFTTTSLSGSGWRTR
jgi:hypothetical protein